MKLQAGRPRDGATADGTVTHSTGRRFHYDFATLARLASREGLAWNASVTGASRWQVMLVITKPAEEGA